MHEIELKLSLPRTRGGSALSELVRRFGKPGEQHRLENVYYDDRALNLHRQRVALRMRRQGERWIQTLKGKGGVQQGLHKRLEWNWERDNESLDLACIGQARQEGLLCEIPEGTELIAVFRTDFTRHAWQVERPQGVVELVLDEGLITSGQHSARLYEMELELLSGQTSAIFDLAEQVLDVVPAWISFLSKAQRGYALFQSGSDAAAQHLPAEPRSATETLQWLAAILDRFNAGDESDWPDWLLAVTRCRQIAGEPWSTRFSTLQKGFAREIEKQGLSTAIQQVLQSPLHGQFALQAMQTEAA